MDDILNQLSSLSPEAQAQVRDYIAFLRWQTKLADRSQAGAPARMWRYNFLEHLNSANVSASRSVAGMEVKAAPAEVGGERRPALWQHPPVEGESRVEFHAPIPADLRDLRVRFAVGVRDGAQAGDRLVAFRVRVDGWQVWSRGTWPTKWEDAEIPLPFHAGDVLRITFATDCLGDHPFAWAAWAEPELVGELSDPPA